MKVKFYKHNLRATIEDDIEKVKKYFTDFDIFLETEIGETNIPFDKAFDLFKKEVGKFDVIIYLFDRYQYPQMPSYGLAQNYTKQTKIVLQATDTIHDNIDYLWKSISHEIMHTMFYKIYDLNVFIVDPMDTYVKNEEPYATDGNFARAWDNLRQFKYLFNPVVKLERLNYSDVQTTGNLKYNDFNCKTLERAWKDNKPNISCIPKGTYQVKWTYSPRFLKYTYEIQNIKGRSGIRIHSANFWSQLNGCVSLGDNFKDINKDDQLDVINSRITIKKFEDLLYKYPFTIIIN